MTPTQRGRALLAVGAAAGIALAATGMLERSGVAPSVPEDAVAMVNGNPISRGDYSRAVAAVAADRRNRRLTVDQREQVLYRLIDDELLVQRGLELRLASRDPRVRANLSGAVIDLIVARADAQGTHVSDKVLHAFYAEHQAYFRRPAMLRVRLLSRKGLVVELPDALLPLAKLRDYVGAKVVSQLLALKVGATTQAGARTYRLVERRGGNIPDFTTIKVAVATEYRRRAGDTLLRETLNRRRDRATITIARSRL